MPGFGSFTHTWHSKSYPAIDPTQPALRLENKTILITGGGRGIGPSIAKAFASAHAKAVVVVGRTESTLLETRKTLEKAYPTTKVVSYVADIQEQSRMSEVFTDVNHQVGPVDVLIHNAGFLDERKAIAEADLVGSFEVNVRGVLVTTQAFLNSRGSGAPPPNATIVNITSAAGHTHFPSFSAYSASKLATTKIVKHLQAENPERLRVFNLQPGLVGTDMAKQAGFSGEDDPSLAAGMCVWLAASKEADVLKGRMIWANWDVKELLEREDEIVTGNLLTVGLSGWPTYPPGALRRDG